MSEEVKPIEELTFRQAMTELEGIISRLEANNMELEDSLADYERGIKLLSSLQGRLNNAQQKVDSLMGELEANADDETQDTTLS